MARDASRILGVIVERLRVGDLDGLVVAVLEGEADIQGKVSRCGDELARTALYEAAHSLLVRSRKWSSLRAWGMRVAQHRGMARARAEVARKLAVVLHAMRWEETSFRFGQAPEPTAA